MLAFRKGPFQLAYSYPEDTALLDRGEGVMNGTGPHDEEQKCGGYRDDPEICLRNLL